jgi:nucleoside-diphosphate-sugar epimerase
MRVLVTGASGFVGHAACRELLARGHEVRALVRRAGSEPEGTAPVAGDLTDAAALSAAVREAAPEGVVHLAAEIATQRDAERVREVNVEGMRRLLEACGAADAPKVVFASTVVTGEANGAVLTEDEALPVQTPYGRSKQEGEALLLGSGLPAVVVRPGHVYGPGGWYAHELARLRQPGRFAVIGRGDNLWDVVHVDDVARALVDALERAPAGEIYHASDDEPITYYDFMALGAQALGVGRPRRIPAWVARLAAGSNAVTAVVRSARTSNAKLKRELGWAPHYPSAREGVPATVAALAAAP